MVRLELLRHVRRHSSNANEASDAVMNAAFCDAFSSNSHLQTCLQSGNAATSLSRFAAVSSVLSPAELLDHSAPLSALRSVFPPYILSCMNLRYYALQAAMFPPFQPANSSSLSLQSVSVSRSVCGNSSAVQGTGSKYDTTPLVGSYGVSKETP